MSNICYACGKPADPHPYRHPIELSPTGPFARVDIVQAARIAELEAKCEKNVFAEARAEQAERDLSLLWVDNVQYINLLADTERERDEAQEFREWRVIGKGLSGRDLTPWDAKSLDDAREIQADIIRVGSLPRIESRTTSRWAVVEEADAPKPKAQPTEAEGD